MPMIPTKPYNLTKRLETKVTTRKNTIRVTVMGEVAYVLRIKDEVGERTHLARAGTCRATVFATAMSAPQNRKTPAEV